MKEQLFFLSKDYIVFFAIMGVVFTQILLSLLSFFLGWVVFKVYKTISK